MVTSDQRVSEIGEFGLIDALAESLPRDVRAPAGMRIGIGDDAAVWRPSSNEDLVVTTDSLVEDIHFRRNWTDWESLGHKLLAVNVSDLAAMGAVPRLALITLGLRGDEWVNDLQSLYKGIGELARRNSMAIAGGDVVRSPHALMFHVTAIGETRGRRVLSRSGAKPGDIIGVTGTLGASAAGLRLLQMEPNDPRREAVTAPALIDAHVRPEPRIALGAVLVEHGATSAMDLSDGLIGDLPKILHASAVSAELDARRLPVAAAVRALFPTDWFDLVIRGGEDYELLFTVPAGAWDDTARAAADVGGTVAPVGTIVARRRGESAIEMVDLLGVRRTISAGAFDHFSSAGRGRD